MSNFSPLHALIVLVAGAGCATANTHHHPLDRKSPSTTVNYFTRPPPQICLPSDYVAEGSSAIPSEHFAKHASGSNYQNLASSTSIAVPDVSTVLHALASTYLTISGSNGASVAPSAAVAISQLDTVEDESALESGNFLSFEDWKRQNLKKAGQSEHVGSASRPDVPETRKRPGSAQNTLDSLGDDLEIDIDFSGLMPDVPAQSTNTVNTGEKGNVLDNDEPQRDGKGSRRSRDAGTTCKERFNYASFDCAANVLKTNPEAKSPNTILVENKDSYMLNVCSAREKFITLELCNDILVDTVVLANFEFFSSTFRTFRVSVSDRYPVKADKWKLIGTYEARNTRGIQAFLVEDPVIWARYVRIDLLTHYGTEFYCPISLVRIHGTTMMDEYKNDMELNMGAEHDEEDAGVAADIVPTSSVPIHAADGESTEKLQAAMAEPTIAEQTEAVDNRGGTIAFSVYNSTNTTSFTTAKNVCVTIDASKALSAVIASASNCHPSGGSTGSISTAVSFTTAHQTTASLTDPPRKTLTSAFVHDNQQSKAKTDYNHTIARHSSNSSSLPTLSTSSLSADQGQSSVNASQATVSSSVERASIKSNFSTTEKAKSSSSTVQSQPATPTVQESFFKSVQKRLQMLESNSSLSLQYIEDQSRALRDAFKRVEQRQLVKTTVFLEHLNATVLTELRQFRQQYDQLWQSTVIELAIQRERYEKDNLAMNARLGVLTDEVIFHRRMGMLQMCLILVCLVLVLFSRGTINNYLELPIVQNMLAKSQQSRWLNLSGFDSPARKPSTIRARSAQPLRHTANSQKGHQRVPSDESLTGRVENSPGIYEPAHPVTSEPNSDAEVLKDEGLGVDIDSEKDETPIAEELFSPEEIERPMTSPPRLIIDPGTPVNSDPESPRDADRAMERPNQHYAPLAGEESHAVKDELHDIYTAESGIAV